MRAILFIFGLSFAACVCHGQSGAIAASTGPDPVTGRSQVKELSPVELAGMLRSQDTFVFDCNEADMHAEAHVPGSVLIVYDEVTGDKLPSDHNALLVFYCYSPECPAAASAARAAIALGFANVYCMTAGITGWQDAELPTEP